MRHRPSIYTWVLVFTLAIFASSLMRAAETLPPKPNDYFNDAAGLIDANTAQSINHQLANFERETSNQIVVAIFPKLPSASSTEDFTERTAHAWAVGQKGRDNGAILFVFVAEHAVRIEVGYGLESVLTDATSSQIIHQIITPAFRSGDFAGGLQKGVQAMMAASKGEYQGTGYTQADSTQHHSGVNFFSIGFFVIFMLIAGLVQRIRRGFVSGNPSRRNYGSSSSFGGGWIGGGGGSGNSGSGSNDSFSGGGGNFGGGGAGGNW